jgi:hypothetical protein
VRRFRRHDHGGSVPVAGASIRAWPVDGERRWSDPWEPYTTVLASGGVRAWGAESPEMEGVMRLSAWRAAGPNKDAVAAKVTAVVDPVIASFGVGDDPDGWVAWGEEPGQRYTILVPTTAGLVTCYVRVNVPGEGPRASAKLIRWNRVQLGELAIETQGGHRLLSFQVEQLVLRGADAEADRIAAFSLDLFAAVDGRPAPERRRAPSARTRGGVAPRPGVARAGSVVSASKSAPRPAAAKSAPGTAS